MRPKGGRRLHALLLAAFFLSGLTGLVAEVVWGKFLQLSIGATGLAHAVVLATFMGGLALGNALFGRLGDRGGNELRLYGALELGIGLSTALFPTMFGAFSSLYLQVAANDPTSFWNLVLRIALSASLILVPSTLMGGTLPVLTRLFVRRIEEVGSGVGRLYFVNSFGAVFGCGIAGFLLMPALGLELSIMLPAVVNVAIGLACLGWARGKAGVAAATPVEQEEPAPAVSYGDGQIRLTLIFMFFTGILTMVYELSWIRLLSLVLGSSVYSFSVMLMTFIAGIALGSFIVARLMRKDRDALLLLGLAELGVCASVALLMPVYEVLPYFFNLFSHVIVRTEGTFAFYQVVKVLFCFGAMALPTIFMGMTLPLASRVCVRKVRLVGTGVGSTFSINTLGNLVGAMVVGHVLIRQVGLQWAMLLGMVGSGLLGAAFLALRTPFTRARLVPLVVVMVGVGVVLLLVPAWHPAALNSGRYRARKALAGSLAEYRNQLQSTEALYQVDGPDVSVAVLRSRKSGHLSMMINGKPDAATGGDMGTQVLLGQLAVLLHPSPENALVIGLGSGVTAGAVLTAPVLHLDVIEIAGEVAEASRLFDPYSGAPLDDERTTLWVCDARDYLLLNQVQRYDVVVSEPSNPWMAGIGNLMTVEFFETALKVLEDDGLMVQWLHLYEMSPVVLDCILNTFSSVFPHVTVWCPRNADILLLGSRQPLSISLEVLDARLRSPVVQESLGGWEGGGSILDGMEFLALQVLSSARFKELYPGKGRLNYDFFPFVEYEAPKAFYTGEDVRDFFSLDGRLRPRQGNGLLLARALGERELSDEELRGFIRFFSEGKTTWDDGHMERLIHHLLVRRLTLHGDGLKLVGDRVAVDLILDPYSRRGDHAALGELLLWRQKIARGQMPAADWSRYREFEKQLLLHNVSIFASAGTERYDEAWQRSLDLGADPGGLCAERTSLRQALAMPTSDFCP